MHFVVTHKKIDYKIPFEHKLISIGGQVLSESIDAADFVGNKINSETSLGFSRSFPVVLKMIENIADSETVTMSSYRLFMGCVLEDSGFESIPIDDSRVIVTPAQFLENHDKLILNEIPKNVDIVISKPINLGCSLLSQYALEHHLEDLLRGLALAVEMGLVSSCFASTMIAGNVIIPYEYFASRRELRQKITKDIWSFVVAYYELYGNKVRLGYQQRYIDFVTERIFSIYIYQLIKQESLNFLSTKAVLVSNTGKYSTSI